MEFKEGLRIIKRTCKMTASCKWCHFFDGNVCVAENFMHDKGGIKRLVYSVNRKKAAN